MEAMQGTNICLQNYDWLSNVLPCAIVRALRNYCIGMSQIGAKMPLIFNRNGLHPVAASFALSSRVRKAQQ